jgi:hypothetical protein
MFQSVNGAGIIQTGAANNPLEFEKVFEFRVWIQPLFLYFTRRLIAGLQLRNSKRFATWRLVRDILRLPHAQDPG